MTTTLYLSGIGAMHVETCWKEKQVRQSANVVLRPPIHISREMDEDSLSLLRASCNGEVFQKAVIVFKDQRPWGWTLKLASITSYESRPANPERLPAFEYFTLGYVQLLSDYY